MKPVGVPPIKRKNYVRYNISIYDFSLQFEVMIIIFIINKWKKNKKMKHYVISRTWGFAGLWAVTQKYYDGCT